MKRADLRIPVHRQLRVGAAAGLLAVHPAEAQLSGQRRAPPWPPAQVTNLLLVLVHPLCFRLPLLRLVAIALHGGATALEGSASSS